MTIRPIAMSFWLFILNNFLFTAQLSAAEYDKILNRLQDKISANPEMMQQFELAENDQGQKIWGVKIAAANPQNMNSSKPKHLVVGVHHGNERQSAEVAMQFIDDLLTLMKDPTQVHSAHEYYIVPVLNIGGYNANRREEYSQSGRSIDPNRDYPDACVSQQYFQLASTQAIAEFMRTEGIVGAVTIHGYIGTFTYPWGMYTDNDKTLDHDFYHEVARKAVVHNRYAIGTHGGAIYPASGSFEDWAYFEMGIWTMLLEVKRNASVKNDSKALLTYFAQIPSERSAQHQHLGNCTRTRDAGPARP